MAVRDATTAKHSVAKELAHEGTGLDRQPDAVATSPIGKLSANVDVDLYERLRELAHVLRVSESSIVDVALRRFFAVGGDEALGAILHEAGATLRRKQSAKHPS